MTQEEFDKLAKDLPVLSGVNLRARVIHVEPITGEYFRNNKRQRCIVRLSGQLYVSDYD